jgi:predicted TIM-barrel fold metal-dependent hydrolase
VPIVDAHMHLFDNQANVHPFLGRPDATFEALIGDYSALPRRYLLDAYLSDSRSRDVRGIIWHEFVSDDPVREARWAQRLADSSPIPQAIVALVDFLDPRLEERLDIYRSLPDVTAVREHLGWDTANPARRFARRPDLLRDQAWRQGLARLQRYDFRCGLEIFSEQAPDLQDVVRLHPDIGFTLAVMGWPSDPSPAGFERWRADIGRLGRCENVCVSVSGIECIFGMGWTPDIPRPWVLSVIEAFGPHRCMLGSHMPIAGLSVGFERLYDAYAQIVAGFSADEQDQMLRGVAASWFRLR